jgi:hypothetical protein
MGAVSSVQVCFKLHKADAWKLTAYDSIPYRLAILRFRFPRFSPGAELVAAVLQHGGLIDKHSNPGAATPENLHQLYKSRATATANPYLLRHASVQQHLTTASVVAKRQVALQAVHHQTTGAGSMHTTSSQAHVNPNKFTFHGICDSCSVAPPTRRAAPSFEEYPLLPRKSAAAAGMPPGAVTAALLAPSSCSRNAPVCGTSGAHGTLRVIHAGQTTVAPTAAPLGLTLNSLDFRRK